MSASPPSGPASPTRRGVPAKLRWTILRRDEFRCRYCGAEPGDKNLEVDHILPAAAGGTDDPSNLITACLTCNRGKGAGPTSAGRIAPPRLRVAPDEVEPETFRPDDDGFAATIEQRGFREIAIECMTATPPESSPMLWLGRYYDRFRRRLTAAAFTRWKKDPAFVAWFYDPLTYQPDAADEAMVRSQWEKAIADGCAKGDAKALELYARTRGLIKRAEIPKDGTDLDDILAEFAGKALPDADNKWAAARDVHKIEQ